MSRILAIGDTHFKTDNYEDSIILTNTVKDILKDNPDISTVIVLGDILHNHEKIHTFALNVAINFFKTILSCNVKCFCLVGNHDATTNTIFLTDNHWMNALKGWDNLTIVDTPTVLNLNDKDFIVMCPYVPDGRFTEALNTLSLQVVNEHKIKLLDWTKARCIFAHQTLDGCKYGHQIVKDVEEWKDEYPMCVSGHIHLSQRVKDNLYYSGSSMKESYSDLDDKTVCIVTVLDEGIDITPVKVNLKEKKILYATPDNLDDIKKQIEDNKDIEYKVVLKGKENELKAIKNSSLYNETLNLDNVKNIAFKATWKEVTTEVGGSDDFVECLSALITNEDNKYLTSLYEHILYGKEDISDKDIFFV